MSLWDRLARFWTHPPNGCEITAELTCETIAILERQREVERRLAALRSQALTRRTHESGRRA